jgi:hypothetical protein
LHAVAEHVLAALRYHAEGRIGLVATDGGFGTPPLEDVLARVEHNELVVVRDGATLRRPITTLGAAAKACGIEPGAPDVYTPVTPLTVDTPLPIDERASARLAAWYSFAWAGLERVAGGSAQPTLWPEHFDAAVDLGDQSLGTAGTFGASPGDGEHELPYLYVTHWSDAVDDPFWNDGAFPGASLTYEALLEVPDPAAVADEFFATGRALLDQP